MSLLPLAGLALAEGQCGPRQTITQVEIEKVTVTVQPTEYAAAVTTPLTKTTEVKHSHTPDTPYYPSSGTKSNSARTQVWIHNRNRNIDRVMPRIA